MVLWSCVLGPRFLCFVQICFQIKLFLKFIVVSEQYGNTGCGVFKRGVQNWKDFCLRINILKGNY